MLEVVRLEIELSFAAVARNFVFHVLYVGERLGARLHDLLDRCQIDHAA